MSVRLTWNFTSPYGKRIGESVSLKQALLDERSSSPDEDLNIYVEERPEQQLQVTVTRLRPTAHWGDWSVLGPQRNQYRKVFDNSSAEELIASIARLISARSVERFAIATIDEFLAELGSVREQFNWKLQPDDRRITNRRASPRFRIRGSSKKGPAEGIMLGPIGAVCYAMMRTLYEPEYWEDAARALELPLAIASDLTSAANDQTWKGVEGQRKPDQHLASLRRQLEQAVGLKLPLR